MIPRRITQTVQRRLEAYPAVALIGPRQSGKTTLAKSLPGKYFDLEQEADRLRLDLQWIDLLAGPDLLILDEAQTWPELFPRLRGAIDENRKRSGRFLLLGSVSPALMTQVSESLAGRLSLVEISPFTWNELPEAAQRERLWWCGGYPDGGVLAPRQYPRWQLDYLALLAQRDLPSWGLTARPQLTDRLMRMLAVAHGQTWNASRLAQSLGISYHTVNEYADYLEGAFLIRRLPPYSTNVGKRLIKSPRLYWRDTGLLHALMGLADGQELLNQPWVGASWEGFVVEQILRVFEQLDAPFQPYFFRTSDQYEADLLLDLGNQRWAVEIKLTAHPGENDMNRLSRVSQMVGASRSFLVSQTRESVEGEGRVSCNLPWLIEWLEREFSPPKYQPRAT